MARFEAGDFVKVKLKDEISGESEWMSVRVHNSDDDQLILFGKLDNEPIVNTRLRVKGAFAGLGVCNRLASIETPKSGVIIEATGRFLGFEYAACFAENNPQTRVFHNLVDPFLPRDPAWAAA